jgi:hypothetical protein
MSDSHGNTPAAWTAVFIGLVAFVVGGVGLMFSPLNFTVFWLGVALLPVALIAFVVLNKMGFGDTGH